MNHKPVQQALQDHFDIDARRLEFISRFLIALLKVRSVNLAQIATALNGFAKLESNARRVKRFLNVDFAQDMIARFVLSFITDDKIVLTMDRTNWKFGTVHINFLVVGIAHNGIALPIAVNNSLNALAATFKIYDATVLPPELCIQYGICCTELQLLEAALKHAILKDVVAFENTRGIPSIFDEFETMTLGGARVQAMNEAGEENVETHFYKTCFVAFWVKAGFEEKDIASEFKSLLARRNNVAHAILAEVIRQTKTADKVLKSSKKTAALAHKFRDVLINADQWSSRLGSVNSDGSSSSRMRVTLPQPDLKEK